MIRSGWVGPPTMKRNIILASVLALVLLVGSIWVGPQIFAVKQNGQIPFQLAEVKPGEIFSRVTTTGSVNPVLSVTVSTQESGTIRELLVDVNSQVKDGEVIARLDQDVLKAEVLQSRAKLADARANLAKERAGVQMQKDQIAASIAETRVSAENLEEKYKRAAELFRRELISQDELDSAKADWEMAASRLKDSSARIGQIMEKEAAVLSAAAKVKISEAELELAQVKLKRSVIRAPVSGIIILKNVEAGQTVAASLQSPPLVTIADLSKMKVDAWVDESDIGSVRVGQDVQFQVDSYPGRTFEGKVVKIYPTPQILNNVVTYDTEIHVDNKDLALKPGMTANITIILVRKNDVLLVPHAALRIQSNDVRKFYPEIGQGRQGRRDPGGPGGQRSSAGGERKAKGAGRGGPPEGRGSVWVFRNGKPDRVRIRYEAQDTRNMEVTEGLKEGDQVVVGIQAGASQAARAPSGSAGAASFVRRRILGGF